MPTLDIITVNVWQILISLLNLFLLFLIIKKFLYGPIKKVMAQRQAEIDADYAKAAEISERGRKLMAEALDRYEAENL